MYITDICRVTGIDFEKLAGCSWEEWGVGAGLDSDSDRRWNRKQTIQIVSNFESYLCSSYILIAINTIGIVK
jgi:hypothetical protein